MISYGDCKQSRRKAESDKYKCRGASKAWELRMSWLRNKFLHCMFIYRSYTHCEHVSRTGTINHTVNACTFMCFHIMFLYILVTHTVNTSHARM